jgi:hypothetical protein
LGRRFPYARVKQCLGHRLRQAPLQLLEEVLRLVLRRWLDFPERLEVVQVVVIEAVRELAQVTLDVDEIERDAGMVQLGRRKRSLDEVAVPVQPFTLALIVAQKVCAVVMGLDADDVRGLKLSRE